MKIKAKMKKKSQWNEILLFSKDNRIKCCECQGVLAQMSEVDEDCGAVKVK